MRGTLIYLAVLATALLVCIGILVFLPAQASGGSTNGCVTIGEVGSVSVAHCVDDANDREMYVSSNGFVVVVEE